MAGPYSTRHSDAELRFSFGTMGSGKSTMALQIHHNLGTAGLRGLLCTQLDRMGGQVSSQLGVCADAVEVGPRLDLLAMAVAIRERHGELDYLVCDEAQFYTPIQVEQLVQVVDRLDADVYCFGLLRDFRSRLFPGSVRLLEMADHCVELAVESRCWCGRPATHNARLVEGEQVYDGRIMVVDDPEREPESVYELRCRRHWLSGEAEPSTSQADVLASSAAL
ncbi:MAG: thymidine kinase [Acidimicrobiales bacterium]